MGGNSGRLYFPKMAPFLCLDHGQNFVAALVIEEILSGTRGWVIKGGTARTPHYEKLHVERNAVPCQEPALPTGNISQQVFIMPAEAPDLRDRQVFPLRPQSY